MADDELEQLVQYARRRFFEEFGREPTSQELSELDCQRFFDEYLELQSNTPDNGPYSEMRGDEDRGNAEQPIPERVAAVREFEEFFSENSGGLENAIEVSEMVERSPGVFEKYKDFIYEVVTGNKFSELSERVDAVYLAHAKRLLQVNAIKSESDADALKIYERDFVETGVGFDKIDIENEIIRKDYAEVGKGVGKVAGATLGALVGSGIIGSYFDGNDVLDSAWNTVSSAKWLAPYFASEKWLKSNFLKLPIKAVSAAMGVGGVIKNFGGIFLSGDALANYASRIKNIAGFSKSLAAAYPVYEHFKENNSLEGRAKEIVDGVFSAVPSIAAATGTYAFGGVVCDAICKPELANLLTHTATALVPIGVAEKTMRDNFYARKIVQGLAGALGGYWIVSDLGAFLDSANAVQNPDSKIKSGLKGLTSLIGASVGVVVPWEKIGAKTTKTLAKAGALGAGAYFLSDSGIEHVQNIVGSVPYLKEGVKYVAELPGAVRDVGRFAVPYFGANVLMGDADSDNQIVKYATKGIPLAILARKAVEAGVDLIENPIDAARVTIGLAKYHLKELITAGVGLVGPYVSGKVYDRIRYGKSK